MAPVSRFYLFVVLLFCSTFFLLRSSAEDEESSWTTVGPDVRHLVWCGNTIYASIHRIQPQTIGGIKLRGGTLFRLYGPRFQIHSLYRKSYDDFGNNVNVEGISWVYSNELAQEDGDLQNETDQMETETESNTDTETELDRDTETSIISVPAGSNREEVGDNEWFQSSDGRDFSKKPEEEGEDLGWGRISRTDVSELGQDNVAEQDESDRPNPDAELAGAVTLDNNLRKAYEEAYRFKKSLDDAYFVDNIGENEGRVNLDRRLDEYWQAPSDEILMDILHYVLIAFAFLAVFSLISLATYSRSVCSEEATVFVVETPDHNTPLLQTYVVSDTDSETTVESVETEHGVVLYQPPPEIEKK